MQPAYFSTYINGAPESPMSGWLGWIGTASIVAGYVAGLIFLLLLGLSNNRSIRQLGAARWKKLQRAAILVLVIAAAHGIVFQVIEGRTGGWLAGLVALSTAIYFLRRRARQPPG
jgi:DMSO/TMAO reductase YedYZ heme-binding membrane subunit